MLPKTSVASFFNLAPIPETVDGEMITPASDPGANYHFYYVPQSDIIGHPIEMANSACSSNSYANLFNGDLYIATLGTCSIGVEIVD